MFNWPEPLLALASNEAVVPVSAALVACETTIVGAAVTAPLAAAVMTMLGVLTPSLSAAVTTSAAPAPPGVVSVDVALTPAMPPPDPVTTSPPVAATVNSLWKASTSATVPLKPVVRSVCSCAAVVVVPFCRLMVSSPLPPLAVLL